MKDTAKKCLELTAGSKAVGLGKMAQWIGVCAAQVLSLDLQHPHMHLGPQHCKEELTGLLAAGPSLGSVRASSWE